MLSKEIIDQEVLLLYLALNLAYLRLKKFLENLNFFAVYVFILIIFKKFVRHTQNDEELIFVFMYSVNMSA